MESMELVSVLMPVYNVEGFLTRSVSSILCQTYTSFELILVDDGSTDASSEICDHFASEDSRIRVFHHANQGISFTREFALSKASGDYIAWVDSDDWIEPDMIEQMVLCAKENEADIVSCNLEVVWSSTTWNVRNYYHDKEQFLREAISSNWAVLWKLLIKKTLINTHDIHFPNGINNGEDYYFVVQCLLNATKIACVDKQLYHYNRLNSISTMATPCESKIMEQIEATRLVENLLSKECLAKKYKKELLFRKHIAKEGLLKISFWKWMTIFPEASHIYAIAYLGKMKKKILSK